MPGSFMRHEPAFLNDILTACRKIESIVAANPEEAFLGDEVLPAAILHHLMVIGEAISRLPIDLRDRHPEVPWRQIIAIRHRRATESYTPTSTWIGRSYGIRQPKTSLNFVSRFSTS